MEYTTGGNAGEGFGCRKEGSGKEIFIFLFLKKNSNLLFHHIESTEQILHYTYSQSIQNEEQE